MSSEKAIRRMLVDWQEVNVIVVALKLLAEEHAAALRDPAIDEGSRADATNDLAYVEILLHKYEDRRDRIAAS